MYGETGWRRAERVKQLINILDRPKYNLAMGYHLSYSFWMQKKVAHQLKVRPFFPFNMPSMTKFVCLSVSLLQRQFARKFGHNQCPRMQKKSTSGWHTSLKKAFVAPKDCTYYSSNLNYISRKWKITVTERWRVERCKEKRPK